MRVFITLSLLLLLAGNALGLDLSGIPSIRSNPDGFTPAVQDPDPRAALKGVSPFTTKDRKGELITYPCVNCHAKDLFPPNPQIRKLTAMHEEINLVHGEGRFWCTTCHNLYERDSLTSLKNSPIDFNEAYLLCGQCHQDKQQDFFFGGHGKRLSGWGEPRVLANCTECHNPHVPQIRFRKGRTAPVVRAGLKPMPLPEQEHDRFWPSNLDHYQRN